MSDISVQINPPANIPVTIGGGVVPHASTHAPGAYDSLEAYYSTTGSLAYVSGLVTGINGTGYLTGYVTKSETGVFSGVFYPLTANPSGYVQGAVVRPSNTGAFLDTGSSQTISSLKNFTVRPTVSGIGVLLSGESAINTGVLTGSFYPLNSNPSGYITGVDLSNYVTNSSTGSFVTTGQTGNFVVSSQTGAFLTTGAADSRYALQSATGSFITSSQTGQFVTGNVVRPSDTGAFLTTGAADSRYVLQSATGSFVTTSQTGQFVSTGSTGNFVASSQTGQFYPASNPSGYITGVDLSSYATTGYVTGASGYLQFQVTNLNNATGSYVTGNVVHPSETGVFLTTGVADERYVNVTGDTVSGDLTVTGRISGNFYNVNTGGYVYFPGQSSSGNPTHQVGRVFYDTDAHTLCYYNEQADVTVNIGQEQLVRVSNGETGTILNGSVVFASGAQGNRPKAFLASAENTSVDRHDVIGVATHDITSQGYVTVNGLVNGLNTTGFTEGDTVYLSLTPGAFTNIPSPPPSHPVKIGIITRSHQTQGQLYVNIDQGDHLSYLHDVNITGLQDRDVLRYNSASGYWENQTENTGAFLTTGAADNRYALQSTTGNFITSSQTGQFVATGSTGNFVTTNQTGSFLTASSQYVQEIYIDAAAMLTGISGATPTGVSILDSGIAYDCYSFDSATTGFTQFKFMVDDYNLGAMKAKFHWTAPGTLTGNVVWGIQSQGVTDTEFLNSAFVGGSEVTDAFSTGTGFFTSAAATFTPSGTLETGDLLFFRIYRSVANANDDLGANAYLLGVSIQYTGNRINTW